MVLNQASDLLADDPLLTEAEVAAYLRCAPATLKMKRQRGHGPATIKTGRIIRYRLSAVRTWLAGHTSEAGAGLPALGDVA